MEDGNFINIKIDDLFPLPEEWSTKEGNKKDLNSSYLIFNYRFIFIPSKF